MADDIVTRLRRGEGLFPPYSVRNEAADEIERLRAQLSTAHETIARLTKAGNALHHAIDAAEYDNVDRCLIRWEDARG